MANKPVVGIISCPYCKRENLVGWDGNCKIPCFYCGKKFTVKRTRMHHTKQLAVNENVQEVNTHDR